MAHKKNNNMLINKIEAMSTVIRIRNRVRITIMLNKVASYHVRKAQKKTFFFLSYKCNLIAGFVLVDVNVAWKKWNYIDVESEFCADAEEYKAYNCAMLSFQVKTFRMPHNYLVLFFISNDCTTYNRNPVMETKAEFHRKWNQMRRFPWKY